jgi:hypothetical protein
MVTVHVTAQSGSRSFKVGEAFVEASVFSCGYGCGTFATDSRTVAVRK